MKSDSQSQNQPSYLTRKVSDPPYLHVPGPIYDALAGGKIYFDAVATQLATINAANFNAGVRANHQFATERASAFNYGTILRCDTYTERAILQYCAALQNRGLLRVKFEECCEMLRRMYDEGQKRIDWPMTIITGNFRLSAPLCLIPCE